MEEDSPTEPLGVICKPGTLFLRNSVGSVIPILACGESSTLMDSTDPVKSFARICP